MSKNSRMDNILALFGFILTLFAITIPKDLWRWVNMKRKRVEGQVVVITGGADGIGKKVAEILGIQEKAKVVILDVNKDSGEETMKDIIDKGGRGTFYQCNVGNWKEVEDCAKKIQEEYGSVDIVVCNAAIAKFGDFLEFSDNDMRRIYDVNVFGVMNTIRAFLSQFEADNNGHIVTMSSIAGHFGETYGAAYCPTKFAVRGLMESLQMEFRDRGLNGIKTTTLFPYFTSTALVQTCSPTSNFVSCMSVDYCANIVVESILKERVISYIPRWIFFMGAFKGMMPYHVQKSGRRFIGFQLSPTPSPHTYNEGDGRDNITRDAPILSERRRKEPVDAPQPPIMAGFFRSPALHWFLIIPGGLLFAFIVYYDVDLIPHQYLGPIGTLLKKLGTEHRSIVGWINVGALAAHVGEGLFALYIADRRKYGFDTAFKWFLQTFLIGFPSLTLLLNRRDPRPRKKKN